jgi:hypothetical protein
MGGEIDWNGLPVICEMYGVNDVEIMIVLLETIRDSQRKAAD